MSRWFILSYSLYLTLQQLPQLHGDERPLCFRQLLPRSMANRSFRLPRWPFLLGLASALVLSACAGAPAPAPAQPPAAPALRLPLQEYLPAPGLNWALQARPNVLLSEPGWKEASAQFFSAKRQAAWKETTGIDSAKLKELWIADYELGILYLLDGQCESAPLVERFRARALSVSSQKSQASDLLALRGLVEGKPQGLVSIDDYLVAVAVRDPSLGRIVQAYGEGKLHRSPPALKSRALLALAAHEESAPLRLFFVGPYEAAKSPLLQDTLAGAIGLQIEDERLVARARIIGLFDRDLVREEFLHQLKALLETRELYALGLSQTVGDVALDCAPAQGEGEGAEADLTACDVTLSWNIEALTARLRMVTIAALSEIFEQTQEGSAPSNPNTSRPTRPGDKPARSER